MIAIEIAMYSGIVFMLVKYLLHFIGWYAKDDNLEPYTREKIDYVVDKLDTYSFSDIAFKLFVRLHRKINHRYSSVREKVNLAIRYVLAVNLVVSLVFLWMGMDGDWSDNEFWISWFLVCVGGSVVALISLLVTYYFVKHMASTHSLIIMFGFVLLDLVFVLVAFCVMIFLGLVAQHLACIDCDTMAGEFLNDPVYQILMSIFLLSELIGQGMDLNIIWLSQVAPTAIYIIVGLIMLVLHFIPERVQKFVTKILYRLSSDNSDLFRTLGNGIGGVGALLTGLIKLLPAL